MKLTWLVLVIAILSFFITGAADAATLSLSPGTGSKTVGSTFPVDIVLDTQSQPIDGVDVVLSYNPVLLEVQDANSSASGVQISPGGIMNTVTYNLANAATGEIFFSKVPTPGTTYNGTGTLATMTFRALAAGTSAVTFRFAPGNTTDSNVALNGTDILTAVANGQYTVNSAGGTPGGTPEGGASGGVVTPTPKNVFNVTGSGIIRINVTSAETPIEMITIQTAAPVSGQLTIKRAGNSSAPVGVVFDFIDVSPTFTLSGNATIQFSVPKGWLVIHQIRRDSIKLWMLAGSWQHLNTTLVQNYPSYYIYEAVSQGFSIFAITGEQASDLESVTENCPSIETIATNGTECITFPTPCDVPSEWDIVSHCPGNTTSPMRSGTEQLDPMSLFISMALVVFAIASLAAILVMCIVAVLKLHNMIQKKHQKN